MQVVTATRGVDVKRFAHNEQARVRLGFAHFGVERADGKATAANLALALVADAFNREGKPLKRRRQARGIGFRKLGRRRKARASQQHAGNGRQQQATEEPLARGCRAKAALHALAARQKEVLDLLRRAKRERLNTATPETP